MRDTNGKRFNTKIPAEFEGKKIITEKPTHEQMLNRLIAWDLVAIQENLLNNDYDFLHSVLTGDGYTQYCYFSKEKIKKMYEESADVKGTSLYEMLKNPEQYPAFVQELLK